MIDILDDSINFLKGVIPKKVKTYDASTNDVFVAGMKLDGVVTATVSDLTRTSSVTGVDPQYYAVVDEYGGQTLTVSLLQTAKCYDQLVFLAQMQYKEKAFLPIFVKENGNVVDLYSGHIISLADTTLAQTSSQKTVTFGLFKYKTKDSNITTVAEDIPGFETPVAIEIEDYIPPLIVTPPDK